MKNEKYVNKFSLKQICEIIGIDVPEQYKYMEDEVFSNLAYSDKFINEGGCYFLKAATDEIACKQIETAIREKAKFIFVRADRADCNGLDKIPHIVIDDTLDAVTKIGAKIRNTLGLNVVGITGSLGKTTTKDIVYEVLNYNNKARKSLGNQNAIIPIFDNLQMMDSNVEYYVQEFGAAHIGIMPRTVDACVPNIGIITCISDMHLDAFGDRKGVLKEKLRMIEKMPKGCPAVFNYDDELLKNVEIEGHPIISFAINNKEADYYAENIEEFDEHITFDIVTKNKCSNVLLHLKGTHNIYNALAAYAVGEWFGIDEADIIRGIAGYRSAGMRQRVTNIGGYNMYIDCYNSAPDSLVASVEVLSKMKVGNGGRRIAAITDVLKLGEKAEEMHIDIAQRIAKTNVDIVFCYGEELGEIMVEELKRQGIEAYCTDDRNQYNSWLRETITRQDAILFKGVRVLARTVDQVVGTSLHIFTEIYYYWENDRDFRVRVVYEEHDSEDKLVALMKYNGCDEVPEVPGYSSAAPVFTVGPKCFRENQTIKVANIPEPIFNIANSAFRDCKKLEKVSLPGTLKVIDPNAFRGCESLTSIMIPEGVIDIGENAFKKCPNLRHVTIPSTVGRIGEGAFPKNGKVKFTINNNTYAEEYVGKLKKESSFSNRLKRKIKTTLHIK